MPRRAYSYKRVSDPTQVKGDGLRRQSEYAEELAAREGWCLDDTLRFSDRGPSGFHGDNLEATADLARFLELVKNGRILPGSVLILENIDRLSRQAVDVAYDLFRGIIKAGIWIATKTPERIYRREACTFMDLMEPIWLMYLTHMESLKKSDRISATWHTRRKEARESGLPYGGGCPAWIELGPKGYRLLADRAKTVRAIYQMAREGLGCQRLTAWLNAHSEEHPPFGGSYGKGRWLRQYVRKILHSRAAVGEYQPKSGRKNRVSVGEAIPHYFPAVVTEEEWQIVQSTMRRRTNNSGRPGVREVNLFTGIVYHAESRSKLSIRVNNNGVRKKAYRYLVPSRIGETCVSGGLAYEQFEDGVLERIGQLRSIDVMPPNAAMNEREQRIAELTARFIALDYRAKEVQEQIEDPDTAAAVQPLAKSLSKILHEKTEAAKELELLNLESVTGQGEGLAEIQSLIELMDEVRGTKEEEALRRRIKAALPWIVEEIWLRVQPVGYRKYVGHAQIYLRSGTRRYVQLLPAAPGLSLLPWDLSSCDFRAGDVGDVAPDFVIDAQSLS